MGDSTTIQVSPTGDIILVVGPPEEKQLRLRVSSTILRSASKVFDAMFSPPWIESTRTLSPESPKDIELPEDDPEAMKAICYAIHHRPEMIPFVDTSGKQILQAVRTIDKYDLSTAMQLVTDRWLRHQLQDKSVEDLLYMAAAASVLKNDEAFSKLTWLAMITHKGSYRPLLNDDRFKELFPAGFFLLLTEQSFQIRARIFQTLQQAERYLIGRCASCLERIIRSAKPKFDISGNSDNSIREGLGDAIAVITEQAIYKSGSGENNHHIVPKYADLRRSFPDWMKSETSICMRCLQEDPAMEEKCKHERKTVEWTIFELERLCRN